MTFKICFQIGEYLMGATKLLGYYIKRYCLIVSIPLITVTSIYYDQKRTRWWKNQQLLEQQQNIVIPISGFIFGSILDHYDNLRLTKFRDKSALYGRELAPGEPPSWP
ncbi:hypothetical protein M0804_008739 [Polistes exclamans]|nr:hypothetical protein M0804_008739 [Polistes exclamans]